MKKIIGLLIAALFVSFFNANSLDARSVEVIIKDVEWYCWGDGDHKCTFKVEKQSELTVDIAEDLLGSSIPDGGVPIVMKKEYENDTNTFPEQFYTGLNDSDFTVIDGEWVDEPYYFPRQNVVYSEEFEGYIGYYINETP